MTKQVTISELQVARRNAEKEIIASVQEVLDKFRSDVGVTATGVNIYLVDATRLGDSVRRFIVRDVQLDVEI